MAQFDKLLAAMVSNKADSLVLADGDLVKIEVGGQMRPLTKAPLTGPQIVALCKEIAKPDVAKNLDAGKPATMSYITNDGAFVIRAMVNNGKWHVVAAIDDKAEFKRLTGQFKAMDLPPETPPAGSPVQAAAAAAPAPPAHSTPQVTVSSTALPPAATGSSKKPDDMINPFPGIEQYKAYLDKLLTEMVQKGASD